MRILIIALLAISIVPIATAIQATYFSNGGLESTIDQIPDTKNLTISFWIMINDSSADGVSNVILSDGGGFSFLDKASGNGMRMFSLDDPGTTTIVDGQGTGTNVLSSNTQGWLHVLMSVSTDQSVATSGGQRFHLYYNDTNETAISGGVQTIDGIMNWDSGGYVVGSNQVGTQALNGCLAELWVHNEYYDINDESVRRKFIGADGGAVTLGDDGSNPFGVQPLIYFTGNNFSVNNGTLADPDFNNGVQTECNTAPPESGPAVQPSGEVNVSIINPTDGSFQGSLVYVNYTQGVGSPEVFKNATLLLNGTVDQVQLSHLNFTATLADGHHNITVLVHSNGTTFDQDSVQVIVDTVNPFDNLNTIIPDGTQISSHKNYTITATNSNLVLHNVTVYSLSGSQLLSQQDAGVLGTTNDITISLDGAFFSSYAPATFNVTSYEEDNVSLSAQTSILLTIIPPSATGLLCNDAICSSLVEGDNLDNVTITCQDMSVPSPSVLIAINNSEVVNDASLDVTLGDNYIFFENLPISIGDYNVTGVCAGDNGEDRIVTQWTVTFQAVEDAVTSHFSALAVLAVPIITVIVLIGLAIQIRREFKGK